jgi:hypothetical protein
MHALKSLLILTTLTPLLQACVPGGQAPATAIIQGLQNLPEVERRAAIRRQLSAICPVPLDDAALDRAADVVVKYAKDRTVTALVKDLSRLDNQARVCRGEKPATS